MRDFPQLDRYNSQNLVISPFYMICPFILLYMIYSFMQKECVFQTGALYFFPVFIAVLLGKIFGISTPMVDNAIYNLLVAGFVSAILMYICCIAVRDFYRLEHNTATCPTRRLLLYNRSPSTLWYMKTPVQMILGGLGIFLPISPPNG